MAREAARGRPLRRLTRFLISPNELRRFSDRAEAVIVILLSAAFVCVVALAPYFGLRVYRWERARSAHLYRTVAVLSQAGSVSYSPLGYGAPARWRLPDGRWRSGMLTTETAPDISSAAAGARVRVWLTGSGELADPPPSQPGLESGAAILAFSASCTAGMILVRCYWLARLALDRRRLAEWDSDWALTGPRWTTHQG